MKINATNKIRRISPIGRVKKVCSMGHVGTEGVRGGLKGVGYQSFQFIWDAWQNSKECSTHHLPKRLSWLNSQTVQSDSSLSKLVISFRWIKIMKVCDVGLQAKNLSGDTEFNWKPPRKQTLFSRGNEWKDKLKGWMSSVNNVSTIVFSVATSCLIKLSLCFKSFVFCCILLFCFSTNS